MGFIDEPTAETQAGRTNAVNNLQILTAKGVTIFYHELGNCDSTCSSCSANFKYNERIKSYSRDHSIRYHEMGYVDGPLNMTKLSYEGSISANDFICFKKASLETTVYSSIPKPFSVSDDS
ncbi:uncharacterized protein [Rutidosis leptorrhynchoides]|uniref:uncharacterized protein isoform X2 n=1 Tax=Rutidosis leptorrhynchoides TaxID=125765 RepID=UPI003A98E707